MSMLFRWMGRGDGLGRFIPVNSSLLQVSALTDAPDEILEAFDSDNEARQITYARMWDYYENNQYSSQAIGVREEEKARREGGDESEQVRDLYAFTQSFYNPIAQAVDMDVDSIFGDPTLFQTEDTSMQGALDDILSASDFETERLVLTRTGAVTGDVYVRVHIDPDTRDVSVVVHSPDIARVVPNPHNKRDIKFGVVSYNYQDYQGSKSEQHNRTDVYLPDETRSYLDFEAHDFDSGAGGKGSVKVNPLGVVPIIHIKNLDTGRNFGQPTFHHVLPTLDAVNEVFSFLSNIVEMNSDPIIIAEGIQQNDLTKGDGRNSSSAPIWYIPIPTEGGGKAHVYMLEWKGNLPEVMSMLKDIKDHIVDVLPEMHVSKMQQQGAYSGQALNAMMFAFVRKIMRMRLIYTKGVSDALSMALAAKDVLRGRRYNPLDKKYRIKVSLPPVLPVDEDTLLNRVMTKLDSGLIGPERALIEIGYARDEVKAILAEATKWQDDKNKKAIELAQAGKPAVGKPPSPVGQNLNNRAKKATNNQPLNKQLNSG